MPGLKHWVSICSINICPSYKFLMEDFFLPISDSAYMTMKSFIFNVKMFHTYYIL